MEVKPMNLAGASLFVLDELVSVDEVASLGIGNAAG